MTKVKTILAEFCSPKDILAINRLGLLKKEERESQPIPWRHRLPNAERRELVKSEMRMSLRPSRSTVSSRDKVKAYETASNPKDSRMGVCLYNIHVRGDPSLGSNLSKIQRERSRLEASQQHSKQQFMSRSHSLNHEPLLLVEREPSQIVKTRAVLMKQHGVDPVSLLKPSYMRPLQSRSRTPSTLTTIDAFSAETKKKQNVWEKAMDDRDPPTFRSAARPCARLNARELQHLRLGHTLHKPRPDSVRTTPPLSRTTPPPSPSIPKPPAYGEKKDSDAESIFITQRYPQENPPDIKKEQKYFPAPDKTSVAVLRHSAGASSTRRRNASSRKTVTFAGVKSTSSIRVDKGLRVAGPRDSAFQKKARSVAVVDSNDSATTKMGGRGESDRKRKTGRDMDFLTSLLKSHDKM